MTFGMDIPRGPVCRTCHGAIGPREDFIDGICDRCNEVYAESLDTDGLGYPEQEVTGLPFEEPDMIGVQGIDVGTVAPRR